MRHLGGTRGEKARIPAHGVVVLPLGPCPDRDRLSRWFSLIFLLSAPVV